MQSGWSLVKDINSEGHKTLLCRPSLMHGLHLEKVELTRIDGDPSSLKARASITITHHRRAFQ